MLSAVAFAVCVIVGFATRNGTLFVGAFLGFVAVSGAITLLQFAHQRALQARRGAAGKRRPELRAQDAMRGRRTRAGGSGGTGATGPAPTSPRPDGPAPSVVL